MSRSLAVVFTYAMLLAGLSLLATFPVAAEDRAAAIAAVPAGAGQSDRDPSRPEIICESSTLGSPYRPGRADCWVKVKNPVSACGES